MANHPANPNNICYLVNLNNKSYLDYIVNSDNTNYNVIPIIPANYPVMVKVNKDLPLQDRYADGLTRLNKVIDMIKETDLHSVNSRLQTKMDIEENGIYIPLTSWEEVMIAPDIDLEIGKDFEMKNVQEVEVFVNDPKSYHI